MAPALHRLSLTVAALCALGVAGPGAFAATEGEVKVEETRPARVAKHKAPIPTATLALMQGKQTSAAAPILMRVFKKEAELEVWKQARDGRYVLLKTFPICRWSGQLGPKKKQGDRQAPEGFYSVTPGLMNPNSSYYLSFDTGFPNAYDRAQGATGSALMVHGTCSSAGCYAMTDAGISEIYALAREAFEGGQKAFQFQAYPFRMTAENMAKHRDDPNIAFWRQIKEGHDRFEALREEPVVSVAGGRYVFRPAREADRENAFAALRSRDDERATTLVAQGLPAVRTTFADGGQHSYFAALAKKGVALGEVSRPETLAYAGKEFTLSPPPTVKVAPTPVAKPSAEDTFGSRVEVALSLSPEEVAPTVALRLSASQFAQSLADAGISPLGPLGVTTSGARAAEAPPTPLRVEARGGDSLPMRLLVFASASPITSAMAASVRPNPEATGGFGACGDNACSEPTLLGGYSLAALLGLLSILLILGYPGLQHWRARRMTPARRRR